MNRNFNCLLFAINVIALFFMGCDNDHDSGHPMPSPSPLINGAVIDASRPDLDPYAITEREGLYAENCLEAGRSGWLIIQNNREVGIAFDVCTRKVRETWDRLDVRNLHGHDRDLANLKFVERSIPFMNENIGVNVGPVMNHFVCTDNIPQERRQQFLDLVHERNKKAGYFWDKNFAPDTVGEYCAELIRTGVPDPEPDDELADEDPEDAPHVSLRDLAERFSLAAPTLDGHAGGPTIVCELLGLKTWGDAEDWKICEKVYVHLREAGDRIVAKQQTGANPPDTAERSNAALPE